MPLLRHVKGTEAHPSRRYDFKTDKMQYDVFIDPWTMAVGETTVGVSTEKVKICCKVEVTESRSSGNTSNDYWYIRFRWPVVSRRPTGDECPVRSKAMNDAWAAKVEVMKPIIGYAGDNDMFGDEH